MDDSQKYAGIPPEGVIPDPDGPHPLYDAYMAASILCIVIPTVFILVRLFTKRKFAPLGLQDYSLIPALILHIAFVSIFIVQLQIGVGRHSWEVLRSNVPLFSKLGTSLELTYSGAVWFAKVALLLQIAEIFVPTKSGGIWYTILVVIWANFAFYFSGIFTVIFSCKPIAKTWNPSLPGTCIETRAALLASGALNIVSDVVIFALPLCVIPRLQMPLERKIAVAMLFALGSIAIIATVFRIVYSVQFNEADSTYVIGKVNMWTCTELAIINICTCAPHMARFLRLIKKRTFSSKERSSSETEKRITPESDTAVASDLEANRTHSHSTTPSTKQEHDEHVEMMQYFLKPNA